LASIPLLGGNVLADLKGIRPFAGCSH